jgi:hypothetical protein
VLGARARAIRVDAGGERVSLHHSDRQFDIRRIIAPTRQITT